MTIDDNNPASGDFDDDDSFALENLDTYPGDLSAFIEVPPTKTDVATETQASAADIAGESEHDIPELPMESDSTYPTSAGTPADSDSSFQHNVRAFEEDLNPTASADAFPADSDDDAVDTDDFVRQLQADLERSKAKKAAQSSQTASVPAAEPVKKAEFTSVEDLTGTEEIDLSTIAAHHPSTYRQMEEAAEEAPAFEELPEEADSGYSGYAQMAASMSTEQPAEAPKPEPAAAPKKEKKNRKPLYMAVAACAALLAIGFGGYSLYPMISQMFGSHPPTEAGHADTTRKHSPTIAHDTHEEHHEAADSVAADTHTDTAQHQEDAHEETKPAPHEESHAPEPPHTTKAPAHEAVKHEEPKHETPKHEEPKHETPKAPAPEPKKIAAAKPPAPKPAAVKEVKPPTIARNNNAPSTSEAKPQIYTVQVYSSPSKDDADERLTRLKSRNATNASISEQMVRGQKWYRVRFGAFTSRDEAESAAKELGFTQCWIDRVR